MLLYQLLPLYYVWTIDYIYCTFFVEGWNILKPRLNLASFPNPLIDFTLCGQTQPSTICDPNMYLSSHLHIDDTSQLYQQINNAKTHQSLIRCASDCNTNTSNNNDSNSQKQGITYNTVGIEIGVVIINRLSNYRINYGELQLDMGGYDEGSGGMDTVNNYEKTRRIIQFYAKSIHNQWNIGDSCCNNSILIFISVEDRIIFISTDETVGKVITQSIISRHMTPVAISYISTQEYNTAISKVKLFLFFFLCVLPLIHFFVILFWFFFVFYAILFLLV